MDEHQATEVVTSFYSSFYPSLVRYATHITGSRDMAQDIVQEAFMRLYRTLRLNRDVENPKAWAFAVVRHESFARLRQRNDERLARESLDVLEDLPMGRWSEPAGFEGNDVARLLSLLSKREQEALLLRMEGLKYREIGGELGLSIQSVSTLLSRALRKLQVVLGCTPGKDKRSIHVDETVRHTLQ